jgi:hypothetical protein
MPVESTIPASVSEVSLDNPFSSPYKKVSTMNLLTLSSVIAAALLGQSGSGDKPEWDLGQGKESRRTT